jgi:hypothetical protein
VPAQCARSTVDALQLEAEQKYRSTEEQLRQELAETERS